MTYVAISGGESEYVKIILSKVRKVHKSVTTQKAHVLEVGAFEIDKANPSALDFFDFVQRNFKLENGFLRCIFGGNIEVRLTMQAAAENILIANSYFLEMQNQWVKSSRCSVVKFYIERADTEYCGLPMSKTSWEDKLWHKLHIRKLQREKSRWLNNK